MEAGTALFTGLALIGLTSVIGMRLAILAGFLIILVLSISLFLGLSKGQKPPTAGLKDFGTILLAILMSAMSTFVSRIESVGTLPSPRQSFEKGFSWFPGLGFTKQVREDFVRRGAKYVREGTVEVEKSPETLAREVRMTYDKAGQYLSDGEANIALFLAIISLLPILPENLSPPIWLTPPDWAAAALSATILVAVGLRHAALNAVLYQDITISESQEQLAVMSDWNQYLSNGTKILQAIALFRAIKAISTTAYNYYMDWVFKESIKGDGANAIGLASQWRELTCFVIADRQDISPSEASQQIFSEDIFEKTNHGEVPYINI